MFTGLIEELGNVKSIHRKRDGVVLTIHSSEISKDLKVGDSVSINGVCLTVIENKKNLFKVDVTKETLECTTLSNFKINEKVNLERAVKAETRLGGHILTGHIDCTAKIRNRKKNGLSTDFFIELDRKYRNYLVEKGSISVDGVSLTVTSVREDGFSVTIIPHTAHNTTFGFKRIGDEVNIELDIIGKYIIKYLSRYETEKI